MRGDPIGPPRIRPGAGYWAASPSAMRSSALAGANRSWKAAFFNSAALMAKALNFPASTSLG
jgi:hypothetical protein